MQSEVFGFYAVRAAIRGAVLGINYLAAADAMIDAGLNAPAVLCGYSAAFHALHGWLSCRGRVICDRAFWPDEGGAPSVVIAKLTLHNRWHFEAGRRSHTSRWHMIEEVAGGAGEALPSYYEIIFDCLYSNQGRRPRQDLHAVLREGRAGPKPLSAVLSEPERYSVPLGTESLLRSFLAGIAQLRHESVYRGSGDDPWLTEALVNGDADGGDLGNQAKLVLAFAEEKLKDTATGALDLLQCAGLSPEVLQWLFLAVETPWFDHPRFDAIRDGNLKFAAMTLHEAYTTGAHRSPSPTPVQGG